MTSRRTALDRERLRLYLRILSAGAAVGALFGLRLGLDRATPLLLNIASGVVDALLISGAIAGLEIFALRSGPAARRLHALPFAAAVALKTVVYGALIAAVVVGSGLAIDALLPPELAGSGIDPRTTGLIIAASLGTTLAFVVLMQATGLVGRRTFRDLILGRYRRPRAERRFFLFVDVVGSTALAERLGALEAHNFLAAVFAAVAEPVAACRGEVYQYVGDEVVVTWTEDEARADAGPLRCYFEMARALEAGRAAFEGRFGAAPALRAALHFGEVIAGEVGVMRRAIVYHGDVMNTASRLEQATRDLGRRFIASDAAVRALAAPPELVLEDLGALALRGRQDAVRAWAVAARG